MRRPCSVAAVHSLALLVCAPAVATQSKLESLLARAEANGVRTGVVVVDGDSGRPLFRHRDDEGFLPASNQKVLTAIAALSGLGSDYRFRTVFRLRDGWLEVVAGGDPNWETGGVEDPAAIFARVQRALTAAGVTAVRGIRLVAGPFTGPARPLGWPEDQFDRHYAAPTGGLVLDAGCYRLEISSPGRARDADLRIVAPPHGLSISGRLPLTKDTKKGSRYGFVVAEGQIRARGNFLRGAKARIVKGAVRDPAALFASSCEWILRGGGLTIDPSARPSDREVYVHESSLSLALGPVLRDSSNFHAEQLLRVLGAETLGDGSFAGGIKAVRQQLVELLGPLPGAVRIADGSGLSRQDQVTPAFLGRALVTALGQPFGEAIVANLARGGFDGTLERRFAAPPLRGRVRAKTGTLRGVSALSGFVTPNGRGGGIRAFVILMNYQRRTGPTPRELQDRMVEAIAALDT